MKPAVFTVYVRDVYIHLCGGISSRISTEVAAGVEDQRLQILGEYSAASVIRQSSLRLGRLFWFHLSIFAIISPSLELSYCLILASPSLILVFRHTMKKLFGKNTENRREEERYELVLCSQKKFLYAKLATRQFLGPILTAL